jgi:hypothetical protein
VNPKLLPCSNQLVLANTERGSAGCPLSTQKLTLQIKPQTFPGGSGLVFLALTNELDSDAAWLTPIRLFETALGSTIFRDARERCAAERWRSELPH